MKKRLGAIILVAAMLLSVLVIPAGAASVEDFTDVKAGMWYYDYVKYVVENGYFNGTSVEKPTFSPNETMTRAMFVTVLSRIEKKNTEGFEVDDAAVLDFTDAASIPAWAVGAVKWAVDNKIVDGFPEDNTFRPDDAVTRPQMAKLIHAYVKYHEGEVGAEEVIETRITESFKDADKIPEWAAADIEYCRQQGILIGFEDQTFRPDTNSTRAQVAAVAQRVDFKANYWTITYDANAEGVTAPDAQRVKKGESVKLAAALTREGYNFLGWATDKAATAAEFAAEADYTPTGDVTLYAVWEKVETPPTPETVTVTYDANQPEDKIFVGMKAIADKASELAGKALGAAAEYGGKAETEIGSWVGGTQLDIADAGFECGFVGNTDDLTNPASQTVAKGAEITVAPALEYIGFTFDGWYDGDGNKWEGTKALDKDVTLTAKWVPNTAPIEFTATADAALGEDFVAAVISTAAFVGSIVTSDGREQARDLYYRVEDAVKELTSEYGLYDEQQELWETAKTKKTIRAVINKAYDMAYDFVISHRTAYSDKFRDDGGYYFDKMTISVGGENLCVDTNSGAGPLDYYVEDTTLTAKTAAKRIAKQVALDLEDELKAYTAPTDQISLTYEVDVKFDVNANGDYSNPNYKLTGTVNLDANGNFQYYWDAANEAHVFIACVDSNDVIEAMKQLVTNAAQDILEDVVKDKLLGDSPSYVDWMVLCAVGCFPYDSDPSITDVEKTLINHGVDLDKEFEDRGLKVSDKPALRDYALAVACDFMNDKAVANGYTLAPRVIEKRPEGGWVNYTNASGETYGKALLEYLTTEKVGELGKFLASEDFLKEVGSVSSNILKDLSVYVKLIPTKWKVVFDGSTLDKSDFNALVAALEANDAPATVKAIGKLLQKSFIKDRCIKDFITDDATTGGKTGTITFRGNTRTITLRILDITP